MESWVLDCLDTMVPSTLLYNNVSCSTQLDPEFAALHAWECILLLLLLALGFPDVR